MRRALAAVVLVMTLAPEASAQMSPGQPVRTAPMQPEIVAQATFDTSYLLALYMTQLASAGTPPSQTDIEEAARQYFTNGAAAVGVPATGPGAAYFRNGAEVMAYPTPAVAPATVAPAEVGAGSVGIASHGEDAGVAALASTSVVQSAAATEIPAVGSGATGLTCRPEIEAAMAFASQFASAEAPRTPTACPPPGVAPSTPTSVLPRAEAAPVSAVEPASQCPAGPSFLSRIATVLGGVLFGGLAVALWSRPRPARMTRIRNAR